MAVRNKLFGNKHEFEGFKTDLYTIVDNPEALQHLCDEASHHPRLLCHDAGEIALKGAVFNAYSSEASHSQPFLESGHSISIETLPQADEKLQAEALEILKQAA
jgi:hypothetical protein